MNPSQVRENRQGDAAAAVETTSPTHANLQFPGEDRGESLAAMAQRDLDAALQLLAERAQYITGASGAAIALQRAGRQEMVCRASAGTNAPELGALLSTELGLSGESVRTRRPLRCDDAGNDSRVNREGCRQLGIASVVVVPIVSQDDVLGVFELFAGSANAFGDRDVAALQRLGQMVETAVRQMEAAQAQMALFAQTEAAREVAETAAQRQRMWSAPEAALPVEVEKTEDRSTPAALRFFRQCQACRFPVSEGRELCVECEEKKWRGQPLPAKAREAASVGSEAKPEPHSTDQNSTDQTGTNEAREASTKSGGESALPSFGMNSDESWLAANRHILLAVGAGAVAAAVIAILRFYVI